MHVTVAAAFVYLLATTPVVVFQVALALGAPWGSYAMGGRFPGRFPPAMRVAALCQALMLGVMAAVVLCRAGLVLPQWAHESVALTWGVVAFSMVGVVLNAVTSSTGERRIWLPVALVLLACSLTVALYRDGRTPE